MIERGAWMKNPPGSTKQGRIGSVNPRRDDLASV